MAKRSITDTLTLHHGLKIPQLGFGVYQSPANICTQSCLIALGVNKDNSRGNESLVYRHIDTAQYYANEAQVGDAVHQSGLPREDVYLTTKVLSADGSIDKTYAKCVKSVELLNPGVSSDKAYADLFLVHSPNSGSEKRKEMWLALEKLFEEGKAKSIGVSNYGIKHIEEMKQYAKIWPPHVNQIELHPWHQQRDIVNYCHKNDIVVEAYCPLVRNKKADDPTLLRIAKKHGVVHSQVLIRYCLQKNWVPLPKSDNPERIKLNADVYGFDLDDEDMKALDDLDEGGAGAIVQAVDNY